MLAVSTEEQTAADSMRLPKMKLKFRICYSVIALVALMAAFAPLLTSWSPLDQDMLARDAAISAEHILGTDHFGRDVWARLLYGTQTTVEIALGGTVIAFFIGAVAALAALAANRLAASLFYSFIDLIRALPSTLMALLVIVALGSGTAQLMLATGIAFSPLIAYVTRSVFLREASRDYVQAAKTFGGSRWHLLRFHIFPNISGALLTQAAIVLPRCIVTESVLSFLGLGSSPDAPTWGRMIADAAPLIERAPREILVPLAALVSLTFALALISNDLRERLDPLRRGRVR